MNKRSTWADVHLDALRGGAALIVALGHARGLFFSSLTGSTKAGQLTIGDEAVMAFFVLSGYLVGGSVINNIRNNRWDWADYLIKRLVRLWIVLIPAVFIGVLLDLIGLYFFSHNGSVYATPIEGGYVHAGFAENIHKISVILGNVFFLQTIYVPTLGTNTSLWSLSNEFWYYLLFPAGLLALNSNVDMTRRFAYGAAALMIFSLPGAHAEFLFLTWLSGALVAALPNLISKRWATWAVSISSITFLILFLGIKKLNLPLYPAELLIASFVSILVYTIKCQTTPSNPSPYTWISAWSAKISYTLYLTHLPFLVLMCAIINTPWHMSAMTAASLTKFLAVVILAVLWAGLIYYFFESRTTVVRTEITAWVQKFRTRTANA
ncbi:acyltransferase [Paraburkholderia sp. J67]|uniref:acyltransferase family protein n=1 Tax=Paraburkholderia sp. J67 TaxID=2805435 RepID=UPI002ABD80DE|nr:acyltransferase [Paraburkholderia sp. J67]